MVRQDHQLNGHDFEQTPGDSEGHGSLACYNPWGHRVKLDLTTEQQQTIPVVPCWVGIVWKLTVYLSRNIKPIFSVCTGVTHCIKYVRSYLCGFDYRK